MSELEKQLGKLDDPKRIQVTCDECGEKLFDSKKEEPMGFIPSYIAAEIEIIIKGHKYDTSHSTVTVNVEKQVEAVKNQIDVEVNVNG